MAYSILEEQGLPEDISSICLILWSLVNFTRWWASMQVTHRNSTHSTQKPVASVLSSQLIHNWKQKEDQCKKSNNTSGKKLSLLIQLQECIVKATDLRFWRFLVHKYIYGESLFTPSTSGNCLPFSANCFNAVNIASPVFTHHLGCITFQQVFKMHSSLVACSSDYLP